jgi:YegS/Rv2252/BmrU family lipid kinase
VEATRQALGPRFPSIEWRPTERTGAATRLAREALAQGAATVLSVGGDGTHCEVINGFFEADGSPVSERATLGIVNCGTARDLCRSLGIGGTVRASLRVLSEGTVASIDVGRVTFQDHHGRPATRCFPNIVSAGMSAEVDRYVNTGRAKRFGGTVAFALATLRGLLRYQNRPLKVTLDGQPVETGRVCTLAVANGRYFGGGMNVAPHAILDDGLLDIVCLGDFHLHDFLLKGHRLYAGTHLKLSKVSWHRAASVRIESDSEMSLDVDGDVPGRLPAEVRMLPKALRVYVGREAAVGG